MRHFVLANKYKAKIFSFNNMNMFYCEEILNHLSVVFEFSFGLNQRQLIELKKSKTVHYVTKCFGSVKSFK